MMIIFLLIAFLMGSVAGVFTILLMMGVSRSNYHEDRELTKEEWREDYE